MVEFREQRGTVGRIQSWLARRCHAPLGAWGEWVALCYLLHIGCDVLARNWKCRQGEIDLIARDGVMLVFVEVKTRRLPQLAPPELSITDAKRERLERLAGQFIQRHELDSEPVRVDLIAIETCDQQTFTLRHYLGILD